MRYLAKIGRNAVVGIGTNGIQTKDDDISECCCRIALTSAFLILADLVQYVACPLLIEEETRKFVTLFSCRLYRCHRLRVQFKYAIKK